MTKNNQNGRILCAHMQMGYGRIARLGSERGRVSNLSSGFKVGWPIHSQPFVTDGCHRDLHRACVVVGQSKISNRRKCAEYTRWRACMRRRREINKLSIVLRVKRKHHVPNIVAHQRFQSRCRSGHDLCSLLEQRQSS